MTDPATALGRDLANRALEDEDWAREKLAVHAGRSFSVSSGPFASAFTIGDDGTLEAAGANAPDVELTLSPFDLPALLADPSRWSTLVTSRGDPGLIGTLQELAITLPWFVERGLAKAFGPIVGQRLADTGRSLLGFPEHAGSRFAESVASFARDESGTLARGEEGRAFARDIEEVAARVDALAERVARLAGGLS